MYYKKIFLVAVVSLFLIGCNDKPDYEVEGAGDTSYSELTTEEIKGWLEDESLELLKLCQAAQTSPAIEALQNLNDVLNIASFEIAGKTVNKVDDIFEFADLYRVFTWNADKNDWDETSSTTEFKIIFPAKKGATSNNAVFSASAVNSGIEVIYSYEKCDYNTWPVDCKVCEDTYRLPSSVTATLTISGTEVARFEFSARYEGNNPVPVEFGYTLTTSDKYSFTYKLQKGAVNKFEMKVSYDGKTMFDIRFQSGAKIDDIYNSVMDGDNINDNFNLFDEVDGYMQLMEDLILVYKGDITGFATEMNAISEDYWNKLDDLYETWPNNENYYNIMGQIKKEKSDKNAAAFNKYITSELKSTKDGTKIAELVMVSEKHGNGYWNYYTWNGSRWDYHHSWLETWKYDEYMNKPYLKFKDNTLIEASVYFSEVFDMIENEWKDFIKAFDR